MQAQFTTVAAVVGYLHADCAFGVYLTRDEIAAIVTPLRTSQYGAIFGDELHTMYNAVNAAAWQRDDAEQLDPEQYMDRLETLNAETRSLVASR